MSLALAAISYVGLKYALPSLAVENPIGAAMLRVAPQAAAIVAALFVLIAVVSLGRQTRARAILDAQVSLESIRALSWQEFETLIGEYWRRRGFEVTETGGGGADGGVDLVLKREGERFLVQCKQYRALSVGVRPVRELFGVMAAEGATGGYLVSSGSYTPDAMAFARGKALELIDGDVLLQMINEVKVARIEKTRRWDEAGKVPSCPSCGSRMVKRKARRGAGAGQVFWGCPAYPRCRGTRSG